jgi:hypothetical protein
MRPHDIKESDWRTLRRLQPLALERFCKRVLDEIESVRHDSARTFHHRYLDIYRIVEQRDREMASIFNDVRRSNAMVKLALMRSSGLLEEPEIASCAKKTRAAIASRSSRRSQRSLAPPPSPLPTKVYQAHDHESRRELTLFDTLTARPHPRGEWDLAASDSLPQAVSTT